MTPASERRCWICDRINWIELTLPHGHLCRGCRARRHYHPGICPVCGQRRPLAYIDDQLVICAGCAGVDSDFACQACGSEEHPYGGARCARCILAERLGELLTDPTTGAIHTRLQPVFDELVGSERPQTGIWWLLKKKPGVGPRLLGLMARGELAISHDTFRALPSDRAHDYLRSLLAALGVIEPFDPRIERMGPWLDEFLTTVPDAHVDILRRYTHWHILRHMRDAARQGLLTQAIANAKRRCIKVAAEFLAYLDSRGLTIEAATQADLEGFAEHASRKLNHEHSFIAWLRNSRINTNLQIPYVPRSEPEVNVGDEHRWAIVERLLHDTTIRRYTRIGGLFTLLFAQPLSRIVAMRADQVSEIDGRVHITFNNVPIQMPVLVDDLIRDHLQHRGKSLYASRGTGWLFPGGNPGRHLSTENIRAQLVEIGIKPYEGRKATLFQLAADVPAPVLGELIGISHKNAAEWARLSARDWRDYIATRA